MHQISKEELLLTQKIHLASAASEDRELVAVIDYGLNTVKYRAKGGALYPRTTCSTLDDAIEVYNTGKCKAIAEDIRLAVVRLQVKGYIGKWATVFSQEGEDLKVRCRDEILTVPRNMVEPVTGIEESRTAPPVTVGADVIVNSGKGTGKHAEVVDVFFDTDEKEYLFFVSFGDGWEGCYNIDNFRVVE